MKRILAAPIAAVALVVVASSALAGPMPPSSVVWSYNWTPSSPAIFSDQGSSAGVLVSNDQPVAGVTGTSIIDATKLTILSANTTPNSESFVSSGGYGLGLKLWLGSSATAPTNPADIASFNFQGKLSGTFSATNSLISNGFGPGGKMAFQTESQTIGGYTFTVSLNSFTPPGPPITTGGLPVTAGSISALVTITPAIGPAGVPEPSTMLLSGMGLLFLGGAAWRKRRQARLALSA